MFDIYTRAKTEVRYNASAFLGMLYRDKGLLTAKRLINAPQESDGFTTLQQAGRLDLTVEAVVLSEARWRSLFTEEELDKARNRLRRAQYEPKEG